MAAAGREGGPGYSTTYLMRILGNRVWFRVVIKSAPTAAAQMNIMERSRMVTRRKSAIRYRNAKCTMRSSTKLPTIIIDF